MKLLAAVVLFSCIQTLHAQKVFVMNAARLAEVKKEYKEKKKPTVELIEELEQQATRFLSMKPVSVMDKAFTPVSGDKHDYMSQAPYFWYDSTKPNGLPYMRKDGVRNPEINKITDRRYIGELENATRILGLAWYLTGNEKYAEKASVLLKHWFLNENTRMNPHLEYAQAIPGINNGRGIGIIETRALITIADAVGLLQGSAHWSEADTKSMQQWYAKYLDWLLTSKNGNDEHAAKNNHGTWYYAQVISFALFTGNTSKAKELSEESKRRLDIQLTKKGEQPLELDRTNGLGYSTMNLQGWFVVATLAEKVNVDLWNYETPEGSGIRRALYWLIPYAVGTSKWTYHQIGGYDKKAIYSLLLDAGNRFEETNYKAYAADNLDGEINDVLIDILYKKD